MNIKFITYFIVYNVFISKIVLGMEYAHFDHRCRNIGNIIPILILNGNSLNKCVEQCWLRQGCMSVIYKRLFPICELYSVDVSELQPAKLGKSCTVIRIEDIHLDGTEVLTSNIITSNAFYFFDGTLYLYVILTKYIHGLTF